MIQPIVRERITDRVVEQIVDVRVPEIPEHIVEVVNVVPQERLQQPKEFDRRKLESTNEGRIRSG